MMKPKVTFMRQAVNQVFDQYKGAAIPLPALVALITQKLTIPPGDEKATMKAIDAFIHAEASRGKLSIRSGRDGGIRRVKDHPKDPATNNDLEDIKFAMVWLSGYTTQTRKLKHGSTVRELNQVLKETIGRLQVKE